jgi:hypothetical protein
VSGGLVACGPSSAPDGEEAISATRVEVCHTTGSGVRVLEVASSAVSAHLGHGDLLAGTWTIDEDGAGFGVGGASDCPADADADGVGWTTTDGDCDDLDDATAPDAEEVCGDGIDNNCDGQVDEDCVVVAEECPCFTAADLQDYADLRAAAEDAILAAPGGFWFGGDIRAFSTVVYNDAWLSGSADTRDLAGVTVASGRFEASGTSCSVSYTEQTYQADGGLLTTASEWTSQPVTAAEEQGCLDEIDTFLADNPDVTD